MGVEAGGGVVTAGVVTGAGEVAGDGAAGGEGGGVRLTGGVRGTDLRGTGALRTIRGDVGVVLSPGVVRTTTKRRTDVPVPLVLDAVWITGVAASGRARVRVVACRAAVTGAGEVTGWVAVGGPVATGGSDPSLTALVTANAPPASTAAATTAVELRTCRRQPTPRFPDWSSLQSATITRYRALRIPHRSACGIRRRGGADPQSVFRG